MGYIINGHYMFGNTFIQPEMYGYKHIHHHNMASTHICCPYPDVPSHTHYHGDTGCYAGYECDGNKIDAPYREPNEYAHPDDCECELCKLGISRDPLLYNVINIETSIIKTLKITLYGIKKEMDTTIEMTVGKRYAITYATEHGLITSVGTLELISDSIPEACVKYINNVSSYTTTAYIGMDCSTVGKSDKRKIYISTIRLVKALESDEEVEVVETKTTAERLNELLDMIDRGELVFCKHDENGNCIHTTPTEGNTDTEEPAVEEDVNNNVTE